MKQTNLQFVSSSYNKSYIETKRIVHQLNIKSKNDWFKFYDIIIKKHNIPYSPDTHFKSKNEWISWGDFLGTKKQQDNLKSLNYLSYNKAKKWIKDNLIKINTIENWKQSVKENKIPEIIPNRPDRYYNNKNRGWISWGDFLGTGRISNKNIKFISYDESKKIIQSNNITCRQEWIKNKIFLKNMNIPFDPNRVYKNNGWISWGDFFGTGKLQDNLKSLNYLSYDDAKKWIKNNLNISNVKSWKILVKENKIPEIIPNHPENYYKKKNRGWLGWKDFLGTSKDNCNNKKFISYNDAKILIRKLNIKTSREYHKNIKGNNDYKLPKNPYRYYKSIKQWISWNDFLSK